MRSPRYVVVAAIVAAVLWPGAVVRAASPVTLTLDAGPSSVISTSTLTFTATTDPAVEGLEVTVSDVAEPWYHWVGTTGADGVATIAFKPVDQNVTAGSHSYEATTSATATWDAATSNQVPIEVVAGSAGFTVSAGTPAHDGGPIYEHDDVVIRARISNDVPCEGTVIITRKPDFSGTGSQILGVVALTNLDGSPGCGRDVYEYQGVGYTYDVSYSGQGFLADASTSIKVDATPVPTDLFLLLPTNPVEVNYDSVAISATANASGGTVTFYDNDTPIGTAALGFTLYGVRFSTTGVHTIRAEYGGTPSYAASQAEGTITVTANTVHAANVHVTATSVYPYKDGYRDTVSATGYLHEEASVVVTIRNATTKALVRQWSTHAMPETQYAFVWNGRNTAGALVQAGAYDVKQVITDLDGLPMTVTTRVTVSPKRLVWQAGSIVQYADQYASRGSAAGKIIRSPIYPRGMRFALIAAAYQWGALGYQFTLPSAVSYKSIAFWVQGSGSRTIKMAPWDRRLGSWPAGSAWIVDDFGPMAAVAKTYSWNKVAVNTTYGRSGRTVRGIVLQEGWNGHYDVAKVKLTYAYAVLK